MMAAFFVLAIPFVAGAIAAIASLPLWAIILGVVLAVGAAWALLFPDQFQKMIEDAARAAGVGLDRLKELMNKWFSENEPEDTSERKVNPEGPGESPVWKDAKPYKGKTRTNGENGKNREYYEWDYTHNDIEVYDSKGAHLGSKDPVTGKMYKDPVPGRKIKVG